MSILFLGDRKDEVEEAEEDDKKDIDDPFVILSWELAFVDVIPIFLIRWELLKY